VPLPGEQQPYHVHVDKTHGGLDHLWGADRVMRYDPKVGDLDGVRPADPRRRAALMCSVDQPKWRADAGGAAYFRARKVAVMTLRSEAELAGAQEPGGR